MIKKLKRNFVITSISIVSVVLITVMSILLISSYDQLKRRIYNDLEMTEKKMHPIDDFESDTFDDFTPLEFHSRPVAVITLNSDNEIERAFGNFSMEDDEAANIAAKIMQAEDNEGIIHSEKIAFVKSEKNGFTKIAISDFTHEYEYLTQFAINLLIVVVLTILLFLFISIFLANKVTKPIEDAWNQQKQFLSDASHELKTPLTVVLANTSILTRKKNMSNEEANKWIGLINDEALRMKKMVDDLFFLAKSDENKLETAMTVSNISDIITESVLMFEPIAFDKQIAFEHNIVNDISIKCDMHLIKQLVLILLDNAFKYCNKNGNVNVKLSADEHSAELKVHNTGNYISEEDIEHIFDRFYKVDKARVRTASSHGLGLAIAHEIVKRHNGKIRVTSDEENGTEFSVILKFA